MVNCRASRKWRVMAMDLKGAQFTVGRPPRLVLTHACPNGTRLYADTALTDWHRFDATFANGVFRAKITLDTWIGSLGSFADQLVAMNLTLNGEAALSSIDGELDLKAVVNKLGHVIWTGELRYPGGVPEATLEFEMEDDQTSLGGLIAQVEGVVAEANSEPVPGIAGA